jgi:hypothetical protein
MLMPRVQLHVGDRATPEKVGALVGSTLLLMETWTAGAKADPPKKEALKLSNALMGGFDLLGAVKLLPERRERFRVAFIGAIGKIFDRPNEERFRFFHAIGRATRTDRRSTDAALTATKERRLNTIAVYGVTLMNWPAIDKLRSSKQAYEFLCRLLPVEIVGHDPERIRRMFSRVGKTFRQPGRPQMEKGLR